MPQGVSKCIENERYLSQCFHAESFNPGSANYFSEGITMSFRKMSAMSAIDESRLRY